MSHIVDENVEYFYAVFFHFGDVNGKKNVTATSLFPDYMCVPSILKAVCYSHKALFVTCEKYGCRQFNCWYNGKRPDFTGDFVLIPKL